MSEFKGGRFSLVPKNMTSKPVQAIEIVKLPRRKKPCLIIDNCDGTGDLVAHFLNEDSANKFLKFMDVVVRLDR